MCHAESDFMQIIPAIDIKDGRCVRLYQGDYDRMTVFGNDPVAVARRWVELGAERLHVVDLDGAKVGRPSNAQVVFAIVRAAGIPVQLGGGLRDRPSVEAALSLGVDRVILGTAALAHPELLRELVTDYGERIAVGVDARHGWVAVHGWQETSQIYASDFVQQMTDLGVKHIIYTDISRDGTLSGPNVDALAELVALNGPSVIASGGVGTLDDLLELARVGASGAIVGQALYTGAIQLPEALQALRQGGNVNIGQEGSTWH
jgi:phosphoribosylformimino-5-aminoimidazole carboxamide ribotide isomerase